MTRPEDVVLLARRILDAIGEPYLLDGHSVVIGASIGIAMSPGDGDDSEKLLKSADMALSRAKSDLRAARSSFFEAEMDARAQSRRKIELDLRDAIQNEIAAAAGTNRWSTSAAAVSPASRRWCAGRIRSAA